MSIKKLYISLLTLILMFVTFGTVTFAWISLSTINNIEGLSLAASGADELQISLDGINYSSMLTAGQLYAMFEKISLDDVTSTDGVYFETSGTVDKEEAIPNQHYLSFDLWFQTTVREHHVYLINNVSDKVAYDTSASGTFVISKGVMWTSKFDFWYGPEAEDIVLKGEEGLYFASNSVRVAVIEMIDETNPNDLRNENELSKFIFDPSEDETRGYGLPYGQFSYYFQSTRHHTSLPQTIQEVSYRLTEIDPHNPYQALDDVSLVAILQDTGIINEEGISIYRGKVRINIWIEGWDADAFDSIEHDRIKIQLQFKALIPPQITD